MHCPFAILSSARFDRLTVGTKDLLYPARDHELDATVEEIGMLGLVIDEGSFRPETFGTQSLPPDAVFNHEL